jgi:DNA-binding XRE family transcriptional regulator
MKKKTTIAPADEWLNSVIHGSPEFQAKVEEELAAINIAQDLVALREARGLSQRQLAKQLGVTQSAIAQLETSRPKNVELRTLVRAAAALGGRVHVSIRSGSVGRPTAARRARRRPANATHHSRP